MLTERIEKQREKLRTTEPSICIERARLTTEFYQKCHVEPIVITKAKLLKYLLENMTIYINEDELLVGNHASRYRCAPVFPEIASTWILDELDTFETRGTDPLKISEEDKKELKEILLQWKDNSLNEIINRNIDSKALEAEKAGILSVGARNTATGHVIPKFDELLRKGLKGVIAEAEANIAAIDTITNENIKQIHVWKSMIIVCEAAIAFGKRYAELAAEEAKKCKEEKRKKELLEIARICEKIPGEKPTTFWEGMQFVWFLHLIIQIEGNGHGITLGRFDQFMYPLYKEDKTLTDDFCIELIQSMWIKMTELLKLRDSFDSQAFASYPLWQNVTIGGVDAYGKDACNELTYLVLEATEGVEVVQPSVSLRWHKKLNQKVYDKAMISVQKGLATPAFFNDDLIIPLVLAKGATVKEARDYSILGCVEPYAGGLTDGRPNVGYINTVKLVELVLHNGLDPITKKQLGIQTGNPELFKNMDEFMEAYQKQDAYFTEMMLKNYNVVGALQTEMEPMIFGSVMIKGCLETGRTMQDGGAKYNFSGAFITALANTADSLAALDEIVYNKKKLTMSQLIEILDSNFEGNEPIRQMLINKAPKYGNDENLADDYARTIVEMTADEIDKYTDSRGGKYVLSALSQSFNVLQGKSVGATPDGRFAYAALANNVSPVQDCQGPTAAVNSVAKIDQMRLLTGALLNQKFDPQFVKGEEGRAILSQVVDAYFNEQGEHIQINVVSEETLRDAQKNPDKYRNLMVRVAGYSAYFIELDREVQEDVIRRSTQSHL